MQRLLLFCVMPLLPLLMAGCGGEDSTAEPHRVTFDDAAQAWQEAGFEFQELGADWQREGPIVVERTTGPQDEALVQVIARYRKDTGFVILIASQPPLIFPEGTWQSVEPVSVRGISGELRTGSPAGAGVISLGWEEDGLGYSVSSNQSVLTHEELLEAAETLN